MPWGRPRISEASLEEMFRTENLENPIPTDGRHNAGIYIVRRRIDNLQCLEKRLRPKEIENGAAQSEISLLRQLRHKHITGYIDGFLVGGENPKASIYMDYCNGGTLADSIVQLCRKECLFDEESMWNLLAQMTGAVAYCQYGIQDAVSNPAERRNRSWVGIIHRDIKPANIFLRTDPRTSRFHAVLGDFGLAIRMEGKELNWSEESYFGRKQWACPESPEHSFASDVWAVGMVVQAACRRETDGRKPRFRGLGSFYSCRLNRIVHKIMHRSPKHRPRIDEFASKVALWHGPTPRPIHSSSEVTPKCCVVT